MKKFYSVLLSICILFSISGFAVSAKDSTVNLKVNLFGNSDSSIDTIEAYKAEDGKYYLFLPSDCSAESAVPYFPGKISIDGNALKNGKVTNAFSETGKREMTADGKKYELYVLHSSNLPAVFINTESGSLDNIHKSKNNKEKGDIRIYENGKLTFEMPLKQIKGRGNSTWSFPKKPYNIKFDEKVNLFGMGKAKKWSLLASHCDKALIRNYVAFGLAEKIGLDFTSKMTYVDLYVNSEYLGNYIIIESVEVGSSRVDIDDLTDANEDANKDIDIEECEKGSDGKENGSRKFVNIPNNPDDISGGYLLELDVQNRYFSEISGFESNYGQCVTVNTPEYASKAEVDYIADFYQKAEDAILSETGYNNDGKHYGDYIDIPSFAKMYIIQEYCKNCDAGQSSFYLYKEKGSGKKLVASPIWDFDFSLGNAVLKNGVSLHRADYWYANLSFYEHTTDFSGTQDCIDTLLTLLWKHADFRVAVQKEWETFKKNLTAEYFESINSFGNTLRDSATMNAIRWNTWKNLTSSEEVTARFDKEIKSVISFMSSRKDNLNTGFSDDAAFLIYDSNGATGRVVNEKICKMGEEITVAAADNPHQTLVLKNKKFSGWNTKPDGSGKWYLPGDKIALNLEITTLYAIFDVKPDKSEKIFEKQIFAEGDILKCNFGLTEKDISDYFGTDDITPVFDSLSNVYSTGAVFDIGDEEYSVIMLGDHNGDGKITAADARHALRHSAGLEELSSLQITALDIDFDGNVKAKDARGVLRIAAGLDTIPDLY